MPCARLQPLAGLYDRACAKLFANPRQVAELIGADFKAVVLPTQRRGDLVMPRHLDAVIAGNVADNARLKVGDANVVVGGLVPDDPFITIQIGKRIGLAVDVGSTGAYIVTVRLLLFLSVCRRALPLGRGVLAGGRCPLGPIRDRLNGWQSIMGPPSPGAASSLFLAHAFSAPSFLSRGATQTRTEAPIRITSTSPLRTHS